MATYQKTEFNGLFPEYGDALQFAEDPYFRDDNPGQRTVATVLAKAPALPYMVAFELYHDPADLDGLTTAVRVLVGAYNGTLDGDPPPAPAATGPAATGPAAPVKDLAPWQS